MVDHGRPITELICAAVRDSHRLALYEGLPHQTFESDLLASELATKSTTRLDVFPFYVEPLPLNQTSITGLRRLISAPESYAEWGGEKFCGGFHPDFAAMWSTPVGELCTLVCFGCLETLTLSPYGRLRANTPEPAFSRLVALLADQRRNRPTTGHPQFNE